MKQNKPKKIQIMIIDLGSQYTQIIRRSLHYLGFHSIILSPAKSLKWIEENKPKGIILSGGSASVYDADAPIIPKAIMNFGIPILGVCYGMQWLTYINDNNSVHKVRDGKSYGPVEISLNNKSPLFKGLRVKINAWSSHGDSVKRVPIGFRVTATSKEGKVIEAIECLSKKLYAVQFHPEVEQTEDENIILNNFAEKICNCKKDFFQKDVIKEIREITKNVHINLEIIDQYKNRFIQKISQSIDAEKKRKHFRTVYGEIFKKVAKSYGATHMIQGTLATDLIESGSTGKSVLIKTHHNVDLDLGLKEIMPLSDLFKFEVRHLARLFGLGELVASRQPFPGPGLYLRIIGVPVSNELLEIVREADDEVKKILKKHKLYNKISQTIVALLGVNTVGVKGDGRVYGYSIVVRTVETVDFMTVKGFYLSPEVCEEITSTLVKHPKIVRVFYDFTPKPPATTEFE